MGAKHDAGDATIGEVRYKGNISIVMLVALKNKIITSTEFDAYYSYPEDIDFVRQMKHLVE